MAQSFEMIVDKRERHLLALFGDGGVQADTLEVGDVLCRYSDGSCWVAERKSTQDMANSIKDGRWEEQKARLASSGLHVFYILEGDFKAVEGLAYGALVGAYTNLLLYSSVASPSDRRHRRIQICTNAARSKVSSRCQANSFGCGFFQTQKGRRHEKHLDPTVGVHTNNF